MVIGYHVVLGFYGFWLPNDPRGSYSQLVWSPDLAKHGPPKRVTERRSHARDPHDYKKREAAKRDLRYPPVKLNGLQARAVGRGIATAIEIKPFPVFACSILPEHAHFVVGRSENEIELFVAEVKKRATLQLLQEEMHPLQDYREPSGRRHTPWARGFWKAFIDNEDYLERAVRYVERNPEKEGKPAQRWNFISKYPGPFRPTL